MRTFECQHCGKSSIFRWRGDKAFSKVKYCSQKCQVDARRKQIKSSCLVCGKDVYDTPSRRKDNRGKFCSHACANAHKRIDTGKSIDGFGIRIIGGRETITTSGNTVGVSRYIAEKLTGIDLSGKIVHHMDGNPLNNRPDNLIVLENEHEHRILHAKMRIQKLGGDWRIDAVCGHCEKLKNKKEFYPSKRTWNRVFGWCRECSSIRSKKQYHQKKLEANQ